MSTNLKDVLSLVQTTLDGNANVNAWCLSQFNRLPKIFIGLNPANPPEYAGNCPMVIVGSGPRFREGGQAHRVHGLRVGCAIECKTSTPSASRQITSYDGLALLDDFANLVELELVRAFNSNGYPSVQEPEFEDESILPFFKATWTFTIRGASRVR